MFFSFHFYLHFIRCNDFNICASFINLFCHILFYTSYLNFYVTFYPIQRLDIIVVNNFIRV